MLLVVALLGPFGLVLLGLLTLVACARVQMGEIIPAWATPASPPRLDCRAAPERQADLLARRAEREAQLCFYRRSGLVLLAAGVLGTAATRPRGSGQLDADQMAPDGGGAQRRSG